jgi:hypothetical protein
MISKMHEMFCCFDRLCDAHKARVHKIETTGSLAAIYNGSLSITALSNGSQTAL